MNILRRIVGGRVKMFENVEYVHRDASGNIKKLWNEHKAVRYLRKLGVVNFALPRISLFGVYKDSLILANLITNAGMAGGASRVNGAGGEAAFTYIAIGTGTTAAAATDTTLVAEITTLGGARGAATATRVTTTQTNDTAQNVLTFNLTGTFVITESGVLNAASAGTLLCRQTFSAINVVSGDSLQVTWKIAVS